MSVCPSPILGLEAVQAPAGGCAGCRSIEAQPGLSLAAPACCSQGRPPTGAGHISSERPMHISFQIIRRGLAQGRHRADPALPQPPIPPPVFTHRLVAPMMNTVFLEVMPSISVSSWLSTRSPAPPASPAARSGATHISQLYELVGLSSGRRRYTAPDGRRCALCVQAGWGRHAWEGGQVGLLGAAARSSPPSCWPAHPSCRAAPRWNPTHRRRARKEPTGAPAGGGGGQGRRGGAGRSVRLRSFRAMS